MRCVFCKKDKAAKQCSRCGSATYCNRDCQVRHWHAGHKKVCASRPLVLLPPEAGLPQMYPGPPGWLNKAEFYIQSLGKLPMLTNSAHKYEEYREREARTRYLRHFYKKQLYGMTEMITFRHHVDNFALLGFDLESKRPVAVLDTGMWSFVEIIKNIGVPPLFPEVMRPPLMPLIPRCVVCKCECTSECLCGTNYCSRECQRTDVAAHTRHCTKVHTKYEFALVLTRRYWASLGQEEADV
ncbi:Aste57867_11214 [Aphanomyces stellatus]|uniref:Aste57867_11214 protein n=1 Tax=Aphanomyces stellatus TaxID=120398 RepID=A0A485KSD5_9STRA|nr:hypothetical protein As57867_011172 [Aphanomyces stellatus]VFT88080.1 Aste57867_11214 [Aphanomyces stellatus]